MTERTSYPDHIIATLQWMIQPGSVTELRALEANYEGRYAKTVSGYYDYDHLCQMVLAATELSGNAKGVYFIPQPINPRCRFRAENRLELWAKVTTEDDEVLTRRWLLIDCDVVRPKGVSATDEEVALAVERARLVRQHLWGTNFCDHGDTILSMSGNGAHILVRLDEPNDDPTARALSNLLRDLGKRFDDDRVKIDPATFNAARLFKLYGTMARKGDPHADNPHRISYLLETPTNAS